MLQQLLVIAAVAAADRTTSVAVHCVQRTCTTVSSGSHLWTAKATYNESVERLGWGTLEVFSNAAASDEDQAFAAGYAESMVTFQRTLDHHKTFMEATFKGDNHSHSLAIDFVTKNDAYVRDQTAATNGTSEWWRQLGLIWTQLDGLVAGHASAGGQLTTLDFLLMNAVVDLSSVIHKPFASAAQWTEESAKEYTRKTTHCSALVKLLPDYSDLLTAHNTWTDYYMMLRAAKKYVLPYKRAAAASFVTSGYFGTLSSTDDFSVLSSGLVVQETTNALYNATLAGKIVPEAVLTWARSLVANRLATNAREWTEFFVIENSGTINNQWMVVDYNLFVPYKELPPNTLWIVEQLPLYTQAADVTSYLVDGHWPSYNRPFFPEVFQRSGAAAMAAKFGDRYSYQLYARAKIFRRDAGGVHDRDAMKRIMRYNDWQHDPYSLGDPENAIASRADLDAKGRKCCVGGNIDAKLAGRADVRALRFEGISGPTHETQPVFAWTPDDATPHYGQPERFAFDWELLFGQE